MPILVATLKGCRVLHEASAAVNPARCPHLSFVEHIDENGHIKCQTSSFVPVADLFDDDDLLMFDQQRFALGLDNELSAHICDCTTEDRAVVFWIRLLFK